MRPYAILTLLVVLWAVCHVWLVVLGKFRRKTIDRPASKTRTGSLTVLKRVRHLAWTGAIIIGTVILLMLACRFLSSSTRVVSQTVIDPAQSILGVTRAIGQYGTILGILGLLGVGLSLYVAARQAPTLSSDESRKDPASVRTPVPHVTTALFIISLIGWSAEPLVYNMQLMVNNLRMNAADQLAQRDMEEALSAIPPLKNPDAEPANPDTAVPAVQAATRLFVRAALSDMTRSPVFEQWVQVTHSNRSESEFVRAALTGQRIEVSASADSATKIRREVAATLGDVLEDKSGIVKAEQQIEQALAPSVARLEQQNPKLLATLTAVLEQRHGTPFAPLDAQEKLVAQVLDQAFGPVNAIPTTELGRQAKILVKDLGRNAVRTWTHTWAKNWVTEALRRSARPGVPAVAARQASFEATDDARTLVRSLNAAEGQGWTPSPEALREAKIAEAVSTAVAGLHPPPMNAALQEHLGGYDPQLPGAPDFEVASSGLRIRKIVIDQDFYPVGIDANQIRWTLQPATAATTTKVILEIMSNDQWVNLGAYDAAIVNQALRYAGDGRVVAVTSAPGDGKLISRVTYTHPVLTDTPLGCRLAEADRLLDTFTAAYASPGKVPDVAGPGLPEQYRLTEDHTPQFRERRVSAGPDWAWMKRSPDHLGNIDIWVHTTFSLGRGQAPDKVNGEASTIAMDFPARGLQQLRQRVSGRLPGYLKAQLYSPSYDDFMAPLEDFVLLQRFFRTALAGSLGQDFPIIQLIALENATRSFVPYQPTIRWEEVPEARLMEVLQQADPEAQESYKRWYQDYFFRLATRQAVCDRVSR
ncbi:hypothetical protein PS914_03140 [Pseudomonas fluorescens]|uniref:hypothetical protein n=1 Tax=Pseudomonas fluorescens TaxID=294 RepID=UPI0012406FE3|nr:hypothetical protein [Pseudomonas fluorescens]VVP91182.1 hypothetical protein PS914_03140 [Pseudomonas fluorescens]